MAGTGGLSVLAASVLDRVRPSLPDGPLVVALSGGADSAVCAWAAVESGAGIRAITVDHGLAASGSLVAAATEIAALLQIDHTIVPVDPARSEAALRDARHAAIDGECREGEAVITGHTADDHVETVVMNLVRGAGASGLSGIPRRRGVWNRPLLGVWRAETRQLASDMALPFVDDPDNADDALLRVRIRRDVVPALVSVSPAARDAIVRAASHLAEDEAALALRAATVPLREGAAGVAAPIGALRAVPAAVAARIARRMLRAMLDPYAGSAGDVEMILRVAAGDAGRLPVSEGLEVAAEGPEVVLHRAGGQEPPPAAALQVPGRSRWGSWVVSAERVTGDRPLAPIGRWQALLAPAAVAGARIRGAAAGDRIDAAGGTKAVFEALREAGVPARIRSGWPVVETGGRMAWIPGCRVADHAAWDPDVPGAVRVIAVEVSS